VSKMALRPTQLPIQWVPWALSLRLKRPGRKADHSPPFSAEVKEWVELYLHSPNTPWWRGAQLKHKDNFTFTASRPSPGPTQSPIQLVTVVLSPGVKLPGLETDHSPPSSAKVKYTCSYTCTLQYFFMAWYSAKQRDNATSIFTFTYYTYNWVQ